MTKLHKLVAASAFVFAASASQAAVVERWDFSVDLNWVPGAAVFNQNTTTASQRGKTNASAGSLTEIWWGSGAESYISGGKKKAVDYHTLDADPANARSGLEIGTANATGTVTTGGGSVAANTFTHYNNAISSTFDSLQRTQMAVSVDLSSGSYVKTFSKTFDVYFKETPNVAGTCTLGACEDIFAISAADFSDTFTYDGVDYTFNFGSDSFKALSTLACQEVGITGACFGFATKENGITGVNFNFSVAASVPEPETYAMLLAGLGIMGLVARRRSDVRN